MSQNNVNNNEGIRRPGETRGPKLAYIPNYTSQQIKEIAGDDHKLYLRIQAQVRYRYNPKSKSNQRKASDAYIKRVKVYKPFNMEAIKKRIRPILERKLRIDKILYQFGL
jgi:hypothetical protein